MPLPKGRVKLNNPYLSPDNKFYIVVQEDEVSTDTYLIALLVKNQCHGLAQIDEASVRVRITAEDSATLEYARRALTKSPVC